MLLMDVNDAEDDDNDEMRTIIVIKMQMSKTDNNSARNEHNETKEAFKLLM